MKTPLVVLGCRLTVRGNPPRLAGVARRRCDRALERYLAAEPRMVFVAGGRAWDGVVEADAFADELCHGGVSRTDIVRERCSHSTGENARYAAELLRRHGTRAIELVTSASHMPRAVMWFEREGLRVSPCAAEEPASGLLSGLYAALRERGASWVDARALAATHHVATAHQGEARS
ncbi:MAG: YdcF family protein [Myxococcales bacterium]|nr:YdcF family protein [Myxococcales bacterium]